MRNDHFAEHQIIAVIKPEELLEVSAVRPDFWSHLLHLWTTSVLQVQDLVLGCCLHLSGIRKTNLCPNG